MYIICVRREANRDASLFSGFLSRDKFCLNGAA